MNDFESERAAKAARFRQLAEKHENIATGRHFAARERLEMIPLGQPILVGHHSEKRHRKDLNRIDRHFAEAKEHHDKAEYFADGRPPPNLTWPFLAMTRMLPKSWSIKLSVSRRGRAL
jgi:Domain of unknown function (DUF3560)